MSSKAQNYVSSRRGWRGGNGNLQRQARNIVDSMVAHGRGISHYEPMSEALRSEVEAELSKRSQRPTQSADSATSQKVSANDTIRHDSIIDNELMSDIAAHIIRATMRKGGDPKLAIQPYSEDVRRIVATKLTHSECVACGLIPTDSVDFVEKILRSTARRVQNKRYAEIGLLQLA